MVFFFNCNIDEIFRQLFRERYEGNSSDENNYEEYKKDEELEKEIKKQFQLRKMKKEADYEEADEEISAKSSLVRAAIATRTKVQGLTLKVCNNLLQKDTIFIFVNLVI